jgi:hypothetical protein
LSLLPPERERERERPGEKGVTNARIDDGRTTDGITLNTHRERERKNMTNDDADKITAELSAKVAKMNSFLAALEEALTTTTTTTTQNKKTGTEGGKEEEDDDALVKAEHLLERVELGLLAFAALLKTKGVDSETHEGLKSERKRVEAYKRKLEETKRRVKKTKKDDNKTAAGGGGGGGEEGEIRNDDSGKNGSSNRDNNKRLREEGEIPRANNRVASRFVFNALGGSRTAEKDRLKQEAAAKLRRSIEEDVKNKFEEKVNEKYREKQSRGSVGKNKKKKNDSDAKPDIEEGEYSE